MEETMIQGTEIQQFLPTREVERILENLHSPDDMDENETSNFNWGSAVPKVESYESYIDDDSPEGIPPPLVDCGSLKTVRRRSSCKLKGQRLPTQSDRRHGEYNFAVWFGSRTNEAGQKQHGQSWLFIDGKNMLYTKNMKMCPVYFRASSQLPSECTIKIVVLYEADVYKKEPVTFCGGKRHEKDKPLTTKGAGDPRYHVFRCDSEKAEYFKCSSREFYMIKLPFVGYNESNGSRYQLFHENFFFICTNTCGMQQRKTKLMFTLEDKNGNEIGRQSFCLRVCANPGRDADRDIRGKKRSKSDLSNSTDKKRHEEESQVGPARRSVFSVEVLGYDNYIVMKKVADALNLQHMRRNENRTPLSNGDGLSSTLALPELQGYMPAEGYNAFQTPQTNWQMSNDFQRDNLSFFQYRRRIVRFVRYTRNANRETDHNRVE